MLTSPWLINLFGGFAIKQRFRDEPLQVTNQMAILLAMLGDRLGSQIQRAELIEGLWPEADEKAAKNRFRVLLTELRRMMEPPGTPARSVLAGDRTVISLSSAACWVDAKEFQKHIQLANQSDTIETRVEHYRAADVLYGGDFMAGREGEWIGGRRSHYAHLQALGQFRFAALLEETGDMAGAMFQIARSIEADPLREAPRRRALRLLVDSGDVRSAINEYEEYRKLLRRSVGLSPTSEFQEWVKGLRGWSEAKRRVEAPKPEVSPARTNNETSKVFLPPSLTSFVGRSADVAELSELLPLYRWITLTGPGGIGKTRLAIETARANASQFGNGIVYVPTSELSEPASLIQAILDQLGIDSPAEPMITLTQYLGQPAESGRSACLLVLDGIDELAADANKIVQSLLTESPTATVLATSRKRRGAPGEIEYPVAPLPMPDMNAQIDALMANACVQLFLERAHGMTGRFSVTRMNAPEVATLCQRLEGIPLAIELAAVHVGKIAPAEMLRRIEDLASLKDPEGWREPRHRSLQASLSFSLDALVPEKRRLFCRLCVFHGSFDSAAAAFVATASPRDLNLLEEHSLLKRADNPELNRYAMLDMLRGFGWSQLSEEERTATREQHAIYFTKLVTDAEALHFRSGLQQSSKLRLEFDNVCMAVDWAIGKGDSESAVQLSAGFFPGWINSSSQREARKLIDRIREALPLNELQSARLDTTEGILLCYLDDPENAPELIERSLPALEKAGLRQHAAGARWVLGFAAYLAGDYDRSIAYASRIEPELGDYLLRIEAFRRNLLGIAYCELGRLEDAARELGIALQYWQNLGDLPLVHLCRLGSARVVWRRGLLCEAWEEYQSLVATFDMGADSRGLAYSVEGLGRVAAELGEGSQAARLLGAAQRLRDSIGLRRDYGDKRAFEAAVQLAKSCSGGLYDEEWRIGYAISPNRIAQSVIRSGRRD